MTAGNIPTIRCDYTGETGAGDGDAECDREWFAPVPMPHHRALRAWLRARGWRRLRDGRDLCPNHAHRSSKPTASRPQGPEHESKASP
ncbi:hypothetical protein ABZ605_32415 [Streptomyces sp. NPDC012765]|uniref:hypothetical protein n=1 Tax=Streptomyces sp. NPDC012765 TaxID=3155249 RepID=UPI0033E49EBF